jgi:hypothetical protein
MPDSPPATPATPTPPTTPPASEQLLGLPPFIQARLSVAGNPVVGLAHGLPPDRLPAHGVREYRAYTATAPRVWLLLFRFDDQAALLAQLPNIDGLLGEGDAPPYYRETSHTGAWLLVSGFPGDKPVSPEMEAARAAFTSRFAGEE